MLFSTEIFKNIWLLLMRYTFKYDMATDLLDITFTSHYFYIMFLCKCISNDLEI